MGRKRYRVRVQPGASRNCVEAAEGGALKVYVSVPPTHGEANRRMLALLAKHFGCAKSRIRIVSGARSRDKVVELDWDGD